MPFNTANTVAVAKFLPPAALDIFCKAANEAEQAAIEHNGCIRQGWDAVAKAGWVKPETGKKYVLKDDPGAGSVHVDAPLGSKKPPKRKPYGDDVEKFATEATVFKVDDSLGLVFGWAIVCNKAGEAYYDTQGDHIPEDSMLHAAADFMKNSRVAKDMHQGEEIGPVVFAWPMTSDIAKAMGMHTETTGLMIAMLPPPDILAKFKSQEYTGFSIGGYRVEDEEVDTVTVKADRSGDTIIEIPDNAADAFSLAHEAIKAMQSMASSERPAAVHPAGPMTLNVTVNDPRGATKKTVTTRKDAHGNLTAEVIEAPEETAGAD